MHSGIKIFGVVALAIHGAQSIFGPGQGQAKKQFATTMICSSLEALAQSGVLGQLPSFKSPEANAALSVLIDSTVDYFNKTGVLAKPGVKP
jgi:hypothetical protein